MNKKADKEKAAIIIRMEKPVVIDNKNQSSIELKRNAKGGVEFIIKAYSDDIDIARKEAKDIFQKLNKKYPFV